MRGRAWLSPMALSNTALAWATLIGAFSTLVLVPGTATRGLFSWSWLAVVAVSQAVFAGIVIGVRVIVAAPRPPTVLLALALGGAARGLVIALGGGAIGVTEMSAVAVATRMLNSTVISVIGVALIGATLAWRADFRSQYRLLRDRALLLGAAVHEGRPIDPAVLDAWTTMKVDLDAAIKSASESLAAGASPAHLRQAASIITGAIDLSLRPAARAMWEGSIPDEQPLRLGALFADTIAQWRLPLREILGFLAIVVGVGSVVRSGLVDGGAYTVRYLLVTGIILGTSTALARCPVGQAAGLNGLARSQPRLVPAIAITTLVLLPPVLMACDYLVGDVLLGLPEDPTGQIIVALQTPFTTIFIAMAVQAVRDRQRVLAALQARIDAEAADLRRHSHGDAQRLSLFVHHSVQSELSALAMRIREAAATGDEATMNEARVVALERLARLEALDAHSPPWIGPDDSRQRIDTVVEAWSGILDIATDLPIAGEGQPHQWHLAAQVIEEGLANAARHGGAGHVTITARLDGDDLLLAVADDGVADPRPPLPGLGTQWLERIAPGDWSLDRSDHGTRLAVRIR